MFADDPKIALWAKDAIKRVVAAGLMKGKENNLFDPEGPITRQEIAVIFDRFILKEREMADADMVDLLKSIADTVVQVNLSDGSLGSGVFITPNLVLTNAHVVGDNKSAEITWPSPYRNPMLSQFVGPYGEVIAKNVESDLALLQVSITGIQPVKMDPEWSKDFNEMNSADLVGRKVIVQGSPLGAGGRVSEGTFNGIRGGNMDMDIHVNPGNSGGPIFNSKGLWVGNVFAKFVGEQIEGFGWGIPLCTILQFLEANDIKL